MRADPITDTVDDLVSVQSKVTCTVSSLEWDVCQGGTSPGTWVTFTTPPSLAQRTKTKVTSASYMLLFIRSFFLLTTHIGRLKVKIWIWI